MNDGVLPEPTHWKVYNVALKDAGRLYLAVPRPAAVRLTAKVVRNFFGCWYLVLSNDQGYVRSALEAGYRLSCSQEPFAVSARFLRPELAQSCQLLVEALFDALALALLCLKLG